MVVEPFGDSSPPYSGATRVVFIVGDPVAQVKAPWGLTRRFREKGADLIVVPARVAAEDFEGFVSAVERMVNAVGVIVTVPHKFAARRMCTEVDSLADRVGSVNLMRRRPAGGWFGTMTDGEACLRGLRAKGFDPVGKRALLVGAGGAGIAVADALLQSGVAELCVSEIDSTRSRHLIGTIQTRPGITLTTAAADPTGFDLVVNATLLGTSSDDPLPVDPRQLAFGAAVADLACGPGGSSSLVRAAADRGCLTMTGDELFEAICDVLADFFLDDLMSGSGESRIDDDAAGRLRQLLDGYQATQSIHVAAVLGVADHLSATPVGIDALADAVNADHAALYRLLRALAALGVFREHEDRTFSIAPMGVWLRSDADPSIRHWAMFLAEPSRWATWGHLLHSVRTGENAFRTIHGIDSWEYRHRYPEQAALFQAAMTANSRRIDRVVAAACDLDGHRNLGDIGGGQGSLLAAFLRAHPDLRGMLFDQPHVVAGAKPVLDSAGVLDRCRIVGGDMFEEVPRGCDAVVMKFILHDWSDEEAIAILRSCRRALDRGARLFVVEYILEPPNAGLHAKMSDLNMLLGPGGRERTADEYNALLRAAGFSVVSVTPTAARVSILTGEAC